MDKDFYGLWYERPASSWVGALPLGNGRFGGMLRGDIQNEILTLNEETVWDGMRRDRVNPEAYLNLQKIRESIFEGDYERAEQIGDGMLGIPMRLDSYQPLCDLYIRNYHTGIFTEYSRGLDLNRAVHTVKYRLEGGYLEYGYWYSREAFVSAPDNIMVMHWETDDENGMDLDFSMGRKNPVSVYTEDNKLFLQGQCCDGGVNFAALLWIKVDQGRIYGEEKILKIRGAQNVEMRIAGATDYAGGDALEKCRHFLDSAEGKSYEELLERHERDYRGFYDRQQFTLGDSYESLPATDVLLRNFREGKKDAVLYLLIYNYLRYQLICSSRPGTMPSNLQGIWNDNMKAPWNSDYHPNVNMQINYWPAEGYGLPECVEPLIDWLRKLVPSGRKTAKVHYHAEGWVLHHISDIFGCTTPMDGSWGLWPFGGSWLCRHVYDHYLYTGDKCFLKETALPLIEGSVKFMLDFLIDCPKGITGEGYLVTCPSHSPENRFIDSKGKTSWLTYASTMDMELIWDLFSIYLAGLKELNISTSLADTVLEARERLAPVKVSSRTGCIQEWIEDYREEDPGHRHVSHLFGLYPGNHITEKDPDLLRACEASLDRRLSNHYDGKGWSYGWIANLFARLKEGERALNILDKIIESFLLDNLMINAHGNPQVGDAQAVGAAMQEMLIQSHTGVIELLPSLPDEWHCGSMEGICARGGVRFNLYWKDGRLQRAGMYAEYDNDIQIRTTMAKILDSDGRCVSVRNEETGVLEVSVSSGNYYKFL